LAGIQFNLARPLLLRRDFGLRVLQHIFSLRQGADLVALLGAQPGRLGLKTFLDLGDFRFGGGMRLLEI